MITIKYEQYFSNYIVQIFYTIFYLRLKNVDYYNLYSYVIIQRVSKLLK